MPEILHISEITIDVIKKNIKNIHLAVLAPQGKVRITAPLRMSLDAIRRYAISKLPWIRRHQKAMQSRARETPCEHHDREGYYVWGKRYSLALVEQEAPASIELGHSELLLRVRPGTDVPYRQALLASWYRQQLRLVVEPLLIKWSAILGVRVKRLFVQQMKTKWGSCNPRAATIRLNTELAKKSPEYLEYVLLHELAHLLEPRHNKRFYSIIEQHLPEWSHVRDQLNKSHLAEVDPDVP